MSAGSVHSDQLYRWSDYYERTVSRPTAKAKTSPRKTSSSGGDPPWVSDRTVQTLRENQLHVSPRGAPRPWSQVLPVRQSIGRRPAADGLRDRRVPATGASLPEQLQSDTGHFETGLRHQPRVAPPPREIVSCTHGRPNHQGHGRHGATDCPGCQHAPGLRAGRCCERGERGGKR